MYRVLIADDEAIECRALSHRLEENFPSLQILPCAYNGIELMKSVEEHHPDIIIADINMPGLNGLEAIEILKMKDNHAKIIIHTAYSQFAYAKKAIDLGAEAYILKPDTDDEMISAISNICHILKEERVHQKEHREEIEEMDSLRDMVAKKWLQSLYFGEPDEECYQMCLKNYKALQEGGFITSFCIFKTKNIEKLGLRKVRQMIAGYMKEMCNCVEFVRKEELIFLVIPGKREHYQTWFSEILRCILGELEKRNISASAGVSRWKESGEEFVSGVYEASVEMRSAKANEVSFFQQKAEHRQLADISQVVLFSIQELAKRNIDACMESVRKLLLHTEGKDEKKAVAFVCLFELGEALAVDAKLRLEKEWRLWRNFKDLETEEEMEEWLEEGFRICAFLVTGNAPESNAYIQKAYHFLDQNYSRDISLEDAARAAGVSYFYLSRLLKQKKDTNFTEMLTNIRLWRAIQKMRNQQKSVREISEEVGYYNVTYFYKVFKKNTGLAVGTIRKYL